MSNPRLLTPEEIEERLAFYGDDPCGTSHVSAETMVQLLATARAALKVVKVAKRVCGCCTGIDGDLKTVLKPFRQEEKW